MTMCCSKERVSKFCPDCGSVLTSNPLWGLMGHCRSSLSRLEKQQRSFIEDMDELPGSYQRKRCKGIESRIEVWKTWIQSLEDLLKEQSNDSKEDIEKA